MPKGTARFFSEMPKETARFFGEMPKETARFFGEMHKETAIFFCEIDTYIRSLTPGNCFSEVFFPRKTSLI